MALERRGTSVVALVLQSQSTITTYCKGFIIAPFPSVFSFLPITMIGIVANTGPLYCYWLPKRPPLILPLLWMAPRADNEFLNCIPLAVI